MDKGGDVKQMPAVDVTILAMGTAHVLVTIHPMVIHAHVIILVMVIRHVLATTHVMEDILPARVIIPVMDISHVQHAIM